MAKYKLVNKTDYVKTKYFYEKGNSVRYYLYRLECGHFKYINRTPDDFTKRVRCYSCGNTFRDKG